MSKETARIYMPQKESNLQLMPCPFCGSSDIIYEEYKTPVGNRFRVWCMECLAGIDPGYAQQESVVQEMWNRRDGTEKWI